MIAGCIRRTSGTIAMDGEVIPSSPSVLPPERREMSTIIRSHAIWSNMTVAGNVAFGLKIAAPPFKMFEVGEMVWLEFDPLQMAQVSG